MRKLGGDKNLEFYGLNREIITHKIFRGWQQHTRYNAIDKLLVKGEEIKEPEQIKVSIIEFYENLYSESESWRPTFDIANFPRISPEEQDWLQRPYTETEVLGIIKQCDGDKAPGPDGFTMHFKECWGTLKDDLMQTITNFH
uniref:Putative ovule protein n=1 Tax=Solanum chacoense TaxID=4108 RepID=A0A0V0I549_SOLCH